MDDVGRGPPGLVYPVMSRRSGGLSLGINLFPFGKVCSFDCPYCEVFAEDAGAILSGDSERGRAASGGQAATRTVSIIRLESELYDYAQRVWPESFAPEPVRDLCFSGNGEPTLAPNLSEAIAAAASARRTHPETLGKAKLVLITNSTGFLDPSVAKVLERAVDDYGLEIWAKLDAGSKDLFRMMSGTAIALSRIAEGILSFAARRAIIIQSMLCEVRGRVPSMKDAAELGGLIASLVARGARIREIHAYTFARPTPGGGCAALSDAPLATLAAEIAAASGLTVRTFGSRGALGDAGGTAARGAGDADGAVSGGRGR